MNNESQLAIPIFKRKSKTKKPNPNPLLFSMKANHYTQQDIKLAYQLVQEDLINSLLAIKDGQSIKLGRFGKFTKKEQKQRCGWDGQNYVYCKVNFKPFTKLKQALNEQIIKKYRLK